MNAMKREYEDRLRDLVAGQTVCVTGGTGSIGSEIVRQLLRYDPAIIRIVSRDEYKQSLLRREFQNHDNLRYLLGDVRDVDRLYRAFDGVDLVFHAAALKRVESTEYDPMESIKTNVLGTQNVIVAALESTVKRVVNVSTDKAVNVTCTMGATKLLAERLVGWATFYRRKPFKPFCSVRFGNVLDSRGSVMPLWREQIQRGGPVTLTSRKMRRFFMTVPNAARLVLSAAALAEGGEIFVWRMKSVQISDLCEVMIEELAPQFGHDPKAIEIKTVGITPGEKLDEDLLTPSEAQRTIRLNKDLSVVLPARRFEEMNREAMTDFDGFITSTNTLSKEELRQYLKQEGYV